jgi:hypothetical protein
MRTVLTPGLVIVLAACSGDPDEVLHDGGVD